MATTTPTYTEHHHRAPSGDQRENAVPCRTCRRMTWNLCAQCGEHCEHAVLVGVFDSMPTVRDEEGRSLPDAVRCRCGVMTWNVDRVCNGCQEGR